MYGSAGFSEEKQEEACGCNGDSQHFEDYSIMGRLARAATNIDGCSLSLYDGLCAVDIRPRDVELHNPFKD